MEVLDKLLKSRMDVKKGIRSRGWSKSEHKSMDFAVGVLASACRYKAIQVRGREQHILNFSHQGLPRNRLYPASSPLVSFPLISSFQAEILQMGGTETLLGVLQAMPASSESASLAAEALALLSVVGDHRARLIVRWACWRLGPCQLIAGSLSSACLKCLQVHWERNLTHLLISWGH